MANRWFKRVVVRDAAARDRWLRALAPPHDPFVEPFPEADDTHLRLFGTEFQNATDPVEADLRADELLATLNRLLTVVGGSTGVSGGIYEEMPNGELAPRGAFLRAKLETTTSFTATIENKDSVGRSGSQRWIQAARRDARIAEAIQYFSPEANWFHLYKAHEALEAGGYKDKGTEAKLFERTANSIHRHAKLFTPPKEPMKLKDARKFIQHRISTSVSTLLGN